ncbi:MAG: AAA family ATPase [Lachnospiraceae bacterium]|nr:AAA family ATPase [Lachnospiraceae bacterium]
MDGIKIPVGRSGFADIRKNGYYYIDKSGLIRDILKMDGRQVTLITRPRLFGKTLGMSMLAEFFDIRKDSKELFSGLSISKDNQLCKSWMNQYPTLFLSLKSVDGLDIAKAYDKLSAIVADLYKEHLYLTESEKVDSFSKEMYCQVASQKASQGTVENSLLNLTRMMQAYYGKPVILLMDEYDVPLTKASDNGYYKEMLDVMRGIMQAVKDNEALKFAVITGCLRIAKESIFTGINNFVPDSISDTRLNEYFGFTQKEVDLILKDTGLTDYMEIIKEWYDGYHFGGCDVYCPWDVMNHVERLMLDERAKPAGYWKNSSDNGIIRVFIDFAGEAIARKLETLLSGGYVVQKVEEELTYNELLSSEENLWSMLYLTGYLTCVPEGQLKTRLPEGYLALSIPNREIKEIFETTIGKWFQESAQKWERKLLFSAVWKGDARILTEEMSKLLRRTISYYDYREDFYHAFFAGIFAGAGYVVESNREHGEGRGAIVVQDYGGDRVAVFEVKYAKSQNDLERSCEEAVAQIDSRMYGEEFQDDYSKVFCYGIFLKKTLSRSVEGVNSKKAW